MKYMIMAYESPQDFEARGNGGTGAVRQGDYWARWKAYGGALAQAGVVLGMHGTQPPGTAQTVRLRDGTRRVQDGPYAQTVDQLGGYFIIDVPDQESALGWAASCPAAESGAVEVRPVLEKM